MKLMHIFFRLLAMSLDKEREELTEQDVLKFYNEQKDPDGKLPVSMTFGLMDKGLECVHNEWDADHLITGFRVWRTINNFDK